MLAISDLFEFPIATGKRPRPFAPLSSNLLLFLDEGGGGGGGGNFTKEDDYRGTRGERGDAVKGRFCHSLVQPSISGACLSHVYMCVYVCVQGIEVSWEKYSNSNIFIRNWGDIIIDKCI